MIIKSENESVNKSAEILIFQWKLFFSEISYKMLRSIKLLYGNDTKWWRQSITCNTTVTRVWKSYQNAIYHIIELFCSYNKYCFAMIMLYRFFISYKTSIIETRRQEFISIDILSVIHKLVKIRLLKHIKREFTKGIFKAMKIYDWNNWLNY